MKYLAFLLIFVTFQANACLFDLNLKVRPGINNDFNMLREFLTDELASKQYFQGEGDLKIDIFITHTRDVHLPRQFQARSILKLYKSNQLENYTQGLGNPNRVLNHALAQEELKLSIKKAISHLPFCK